MTLEGPIHLPRTGLRFDVFFSFLGGSSLKWGSKSKFSGAYTPRSTIWSAFWRSFGFCDLWVLHGAQIGPSMGLNLDKTFVGIKWSHYGPLPYRCMLLRLGVGQSVASLALFRIHNKIVSIKCFHYVSANRMTSFINPALLVWSNQRHS